MIWSGYSQPYLSKGDILNTVFWKEIFSNSCPGKKYSPTMSWKEIFPNSCPVRIESLEGKAMLGMPGGEGMQEEERYWGRGASMSQANKQNFAKICNDK